MAAIIFDFDGTIADSFDYVASFLAAEAKKSPLSQSQKQTLRGLPMIAMARQLGHGWWRLPGLFFKGRQQMHEVIRQLSPVNGMDELIRKLYAEGHELFIVTSNSVKNVHAFLYNHKLHTYFLEVYSGVGSFSKAQALRRLRNEHKLELNNMVYVGDESRDVEAAQSIKLRVIAVTWGFARIADLEALRPTALAHNTDELLGILEEI